MNNQNSSLTAAIVALAVSVVIGGIFVKFHPSSAPVATQIVEKATELLDVGGVSLPFHNTAEIFAGGVGIGMVGSSHVSLLDSISGTIAAGKNQGNWRNTTGRTVIFDFADIVFPSGTASSSVRISVGTSSSATIPDFVTPFSTLIDAKSLATSTPLAQIVVNSIKDAGTNGRNVIDVQDGEYVIVAIMQGDLTNNTCDVTRTCESATSTNRGWSSANWYLRGHYRP